MRLKKVISLGMAAMMAATVFAGCGDSGKQADTPNDTPSGTQQGEQQGEQSDAQPEDSGDSGDAGAEEQVLKVAAFEGGYGSDMWYEVAAAFEASHPGVKVELTVDKKLEDVISPSMKAGDYPDVVHLATGREAAYVDGSGYFRTMVKIMMPMATPSIITVILFNFLSFWNEYIISMTLLTKDAKTLPVGLMQLMQAQKAAANYGQLYAGLVIVMLPTLILYMMVQKKLTQGMSLGGLKG